MAEQHFIDGFDIKNLGISIEDISGWSGLGPKRGERFVLPWRPGTFTKDDELLRDEVRRSINVLVIGRDPATGTVISSPGIHLEENLDTLAGIFGKKGTIDYRRIRESGEILQADISVQDAYDVESKLRGDALRGFTVEYYLTFPYWKIASDLVSSSPFETHTEASIDTSAAAVAFTVPTIGNAEIPHPRITFRPNGATTILNPRILHNQTGRFLQFSGVVDATGATGPLTVTFDCLDRFIVDDAGTFRDGGVFKNFAGWQEWQPGASPTFPPVAQSFTATTTAPTGTDWDIEIEYDNLRLP